MPTTRFFPLQSTGLSISSLSELLSSIPSLLSTPLSSPGTMSSSASKQDNTITKQQLAKLSQFLNDEITSLCQECDEIKLEIKKCEEEVTHQIAEASKFLRVFGRTQSCVACALSHAHTCSHM
ncbi:hypothetical protein BKA82DRAFT_4015214 [Pisolithus tinctorius]|nr:hypothetical protein BKA82DRAFT_4015214 [Pisolithus tinctorius]